MDGGEDGGEAVAGASGHCSFSPAAHLVPLLFSLHSFTKFDLLRVLRVYEDKHDPTGTS